MDPRLRTLINQLLYSINREGARGRCSAEVQLRASVLYECLQAQDRIFKDAFEKLGMALAHGTPPISVSSEKRD